MSQYKHYNNLRIGTELLMDCIKALPPLDDDRLSFNVRFDPIIKEQLAEYGEIIETVEFTFSRPKVGDEWQLLISELKLPHPEHTMD